MVEGKTLRRRELISGHDLVFLALAVRFVRRTNLADCVDHRIFIAVLSMAALAAFAVWEEWLSLIAALWLIGSPWLLGFQDSDAMMVQVVIGSIVVALAAFEVWLVDDLERHITGH